MNSYNIVWFLTSGSKNIPPMDLPRHTSSAQHVETVVCVRSSRTNIHLPLTNLRRNAALPHTIYIFNLKILKFTPGPHTILHQPLVSRFPVIFPLSGQILNGISVSGPPFFGERPYPRQFHPVENPQFLTRNHQFPPTTRTRPPFPPPTHQFISVYTSRINNIKYNIPYTNTPTHHLYLVYNHKCRGEYSILYQTNHIWHISRPRHKPINPSKPNPCGNL